MRSINELRRQVKRRGPTPETLLKRACTRMMKAHGIFSFPVTQGMGSYPGLPDRIAHYRGQVYYLEMKTPTGRLSDKQRQFQAKCTVDRIEYHVVRSVDDIIEIFKIPSLFKRR